MNIPFSTGEDDEAVTIFPPESVAQPSAYTRLSMAARPVAARGMLFYMGGDSSVSQNSIH